MSSKYVTRGPLGDQSPFTTQSWETEKGEGPSSGSCSLSPMFPGSRSRDSSSLAVFLLQMVLLCLCLAEPPPQSHMSSKSRTSQYPTEVAMGATEVGWGLCSESSSQNVLALVTLCQLHLGQEGGRALGIGLGHSGHKASQVAVTDGAQ